MQGRDAPGPSAPGNPRNPGVAPSLRRPLGMRTTLLSILGVLLGGALASLPAAGLVRPPLSLLPSLVTFEYGNARHSLPYEEVDGWVVVGGDMVLGPVEEMSQQLGAIPAGADPEGLHLAASQVRFWPGGVIPYELTDEYLAVHGRDRWQAAVDHLHQRTDLRLVERTGQAAWVRVTSDPDKGCQAVLGYKANGAQNINLASGCGGRGTHVHEILHALGRPHEHQRFDRDAYVEVLTRNIEPEHLSNFAKMSHHQYMPPRSTYDYESVMHYLPGAFSKNLGPTLRAKTPPAPAGQVVGRGNGLTPMDVTIVNFLVGVAKAEAGGRYWTETPFGPQYPLDGPFGIY